MWAGFELQGLCTQLCLSDLQTLHFQMSEEEHPPSVKEDL